MKKLTILCCLFLCVQYNYSQDKTTLAKIYLKKAKANMESNDTAKAISYLKKAEEYFGEKATAELFYLGTKLYIKNKNYTKAKEYASQFFEVEGADESTYAEEMYLAYVEIEEAMESTPKPTVSKKSLSKPTGTVKKKALVDPNVAVSFSVVEEPPVYPGCQGDLMELKVCFTNKLRKHFASKFDASLVNQLGLSAGKKRLFIQFTIDTNGEIIGVKSRAPHQKIEEEVIRVMQKLPKMQPGKQDGVTVLVNHSIPFTIMVD